MKMIVMDMDGTLLNDDKEISSKTKKTIIEAQKNNIKIVLASGRPLKGIVDYAYELNMDKHDGYIIAYNGASLTSVKTMKTLWQEIIPANESRKILTHLEKFNVIPMISNDNNMYVNDVFKNNIVVNDEDINIIKYESRNGGYELCEKSPLSEVVSFDLFKILIAGDPEYLNENYKRIYEPFKDEYNAMFTAPFYYEFTNKLADKGLALKKLCEITNTSLDDVIGFGDNLNDLPFLNIIGHSVAMKNSNPLIKDKVDGVCGNNNSDGIAKYLVDIIE